MLEHDSLERIFDKLVAILREKFVEQGDDPLMPFACQQVLALGPQKRVELILAVAFVVRRRPDEQGAVELIPKMCGIRVVDRDLLSFGCDAGPRRFGIQPGSRAGAARENQYGCDSARKRRKPFARKNARPGRGALVTCSHGSHPGSVRVAIPATRPRLFPQFLLAESEHDVPDPQPAAAPSTGRTCYSLT